MPLTNDIVLNGVAYNVVPGTYRKANAPATAATNPRDVRRLHLGPFQRGQRRALDGAGSRRSEAGSAGWDAVGVGPAFDGQGVEPFPHAQGHADAMSDVPSLTQVCHTVIAGAAPAAYIGIGRRIYKTVDLSNGTWASLTAVADLGAGFTISGLARYGDDLLVLLSTGQDIRRFNTATNTLTTWRAGEKGQLGIGYAGQLVYAPKLPSARDELRISGTRWNGNAITHIRYLDAEIVNMGLFNGRVAIATRSSLWFLGGQNYPGEPDDASVPADTSKAPLWTEDPQPVMTHGTYAADDDFVFLASYRGRLYTWLAGRVAEFDASQEEGRWLRAGPEGLACYGGCVAADWLVVAITSRYDNNRELWGFDGEGWWLFDRRANPEHVWPGAVGGAGGRDLIVFQDGGTVYDRFRLKRGTGVTYRSSGTWTSSLLDAGEPTRDKAWRAIGASFAQPDVRGTAGSSDPITIALEYSIDAGATWTTAATATPASGAARTHTLQSAFTTIPTSRHLQLRVTWSSVADWAPVLVNVWTEYESLDNAPPRRRWELTIDAGDRRVRRGGSLDTQTGRQKIAALWDAWETGSTLTFLDIDNDADPVTYAVRIEEIEERITKPSDSARWGQSQVAVTLVEI